MLLPWITISPTEVKLPVEPRTSLVTTVLFVISSRFSFRWVIPPSTI